MSSAARRAFTGTVPSREYTKMFVSRKYLALIHFIARKVAAGLDIAESAHKGIECGAATGASGVLLKPLPKCGIQCRALRLGDQPGLFNQGFLGAQGDVLHTNVVYTNLVYTTSLAARTAELVSGMIASPSC
jgi:hypothetical protein